MKASRLFFVLLPVFAACVTAHPAEYASKQWGCPESRITVADARSKSGGRAYAVRGCGKKMIVECVYRDDSPETPYTCTSRAEETIAAASPLTTAPSSGDPPRAALPAPAPVPAPPLSVPLPAVDPGVARYIATDGQTFRLSYPEATVAALKASGAFDLSCAPGSVTARILISVDLGKPIYVVEGCGQRATYVFVRRDEGTPEVDSAILTGLVPVKPPANPQSR